MICKLCKELIEDCERAVVNGRSAIAFGTFAVTYPEKKVIYYSDSLEAWHHNCFFKGTETKALETND